MDSQRAVAREFIFTFEDGGSNDPARTHSMVAADGGNWTGGVVGKGRLVGSNHGVTPRTLAGWRGLPVDRITYAVMHGVTVEEASQIAVGQFWDATKLDNMPWDPVMASALDFEWGAGERQAATMIQRMVGAAADGDLGPGSAAAYSAFVARHGLVATARAWADTRDAFYRLLVAQKPKNGVFLNGWVRRTAYYRPGSPWWARQLAGFKLAA